MRILIAEDDTILTDGLSRALRKSGYAVDCVDTGTRADAALSAQTYDAVILDLGLPGISGFEVLKRLRSRAAKVPVLILTAADSVEQRVRGLDLGADDFMAKPFSLRTGDRTARDPHPARRTPGQQGADRRSPLRMGRGSEPQRHRGLRSPAAQEDRGQRRGDQHGTRPGLLPAAAHRIGRDTVGVRPRSGKGAL